MKKSLYPKQEKHKNHLLQVLTKHRAGLDGSVTGAGKTLIASELAYDLGKPTLVVAPKISKPAWQNELSIRNVNSIGVTNFEKLRTGKTEWGTWMDGANKIWKWKIPEDTLIIFDECQRAKGMNSQNGRIMWTAKPFYSLCCSATAAKDPTEMKGLGYLLGLHSLRNFWQWALKNGCKHAVFGGLEFQGTPENIDRLHNQIFPEHGARLSYDDLVDYFQATETITTPLDFGDEIKDLYKAMEQELAELSKKQKSDSSSAEALTIRLRARQKVELLKVPTMLERTHDFLAEGRSVVLFVNYSQTLNALKQRLSKVCDVGIIAGIDIKNRQKYIDDFENDKLRVVICNVMAGGVSINLHDTRGLHPRVSIISPSDNEKDIFQCLGRIHRAAGASPTQQYVLFAAGTIEEEVEKNCREKMERVNIFNEGIDFKKPVCENSITVENKSMSDQALAAELANRSQSKPPEHIVLDPKEVFAAHAKYPPSQLGSNEKCCGFKNRIQHPTEKSDAAEKGTRIHKALEKDSVDDLKDDAEKGIAQTLKDFVDGIITEHLPALPSPDRRELRLNIDLGGNLTTFGTCDRLLIYGTTGILLDYKTGYLEVSDAEINPQTWAYVIGAFQKYPELRVIDAYLLVPNRDEVLFHSFKREDVPSMQLRLNTIIRRAMEFDWANPKVSDLNPQPQLCEYCHYQATCPALATKALEVAKKLSPGLPVPASVLVTPNNVQDIPHLLRLAPLVEAWAAKVRQEALRLNMEEGVEIPGFQRIARSTPRSVTSVLGAYEAVKGDISLEDFLSFCSKVSVPQLEDYFAEKAPKKQKGKARQALENKLRSADVLNDQGSIFYLKEKKA